jgi:hypothetical protein
MVPSCRTNMDACHAVLTTPPKSPRLSQLLSYKQNASVSPLFATLTSRPQLTENKSTLSPFFATLTASAPVTSVFATLTQTPRVYYISSRSETRHSPLTTHHFPLRNRCSSATQNAFSHFGALCFLYLAHSSAVMRGWGVGASGRCPERAIRILTSVPVAPCPWPYPRLHWKGSR